MILLLKILALLGGVGYSLLVWQKIYKISQNTTNSRFKVGDRVAIMDLWQESTISTGGHMPFHGEILAVRRHSHFRYEYDILPDYARDGNYMRNVLEHDISHPHDADKPPTKTLTASVELLRKLK